MPNKNTPPKHKTPNWRLKSVEMTRNPWEKKRLISRWIAQPLRSTRKDLHYPLNVQPAPDYVP